MSQLFLEGPREMFRLQGKIPCVHTMDLYVNCSWINFMHYVFLAHVWQWFIWVQNFMLLRKFMSLFPISWEIFCQILKFFCGIWTQEEKKSVGHHFADT